MLGKSYIIITGFNRFENMQIYAIFHLPTFPTFATKQHHHLSSFWRGSLKKKCCLTPFFAVARVEFIELRAVNQPSTADTDRGLRSSTLTDLIENFASKPNSRFHGNRNSGNYYSWWWSYSDLSLERKRYGEAVKHELSPPDLVQNDLGNACFDWNFPKTSSFLSIFSPLCGAKSSNKMRKHIPRECGLRWRRKLFTQPSLAWFYGDFSSSFW